MTRAPCTGSPNTSCAGTSEVTSKVSCEIDGQVATITLRRPEVRNAFDDELIEQLSQLLRDVEREPAARVLVLTGAGGSFCSGADLGWMRSMADYTEAQNLADALRLADLLILLDRFTKPTIARVNGPAFGGGVGLIACCDIAIANEQAVFCFSEALLGLVPAVISPFVVAAIGQRHTRALFQTAERFDAAEALRIGLLHATCSTDQLDACVAAKIKLLCRGGPVAQFESKRLLAQLPWLDPEERRNYTAQLIARLRVSDEGQEGLQAFFAKRRPSWRDHD